MLGTYVKYVGTYFFSITKSIKMLPIEIFEIEYRKNQKKFSQKCEDKKIDKIKKIDTSKKLIQVLTLHCYWKLRKKPQI